MNKQDGENPFSNFEDDVDPSDEVQDWRFLSSLKGDDVNFTIPKRGLKDFEPDGTQKQVTVLQNSQNAMFDALAVERLIPAKTVIQAVWRPQQQKAEVLHAHGPMFKTMGHATSNNSVWLLPEETVYLVERGSMECWCEEGIPMSLQHVYAEAIAACGGLEYYHVYAHLRRCGFTVVRSKQPSPEDVEAYQLKKQMYGRSLRTLMLDLKSKLLNFSFVAFQRLWFSPSSMKKSMLPDRTYRSYEQIYEQIQFVAGYTPQPKAPVLPDLPFRNAFDVYKPSASFKKSAPGEPDFTVCVVNAHTTCVPTLQHLDALFRSVPLKESTSNNPMQRIKEGRRQIIIAIDDGGVISYMKFGDVFMNEKMYLLKPKERRRARPKGKETTASNRGKALAGTDEKKQVSSKPAAKPTSVGA
ncbi:tRNA-splicing endonuclease subunit Sen54 [Schizosaccharomyces japonicus yFS275]|uniref:tRNA-splicing endonuclease subunit Sen54 n=1 Tax=Schizosaccharomyces japonicus (strain yFS275 / FY16936) TaxID=402676 RepID=B6JWH8_SCHJY|nr:tRNA-splicing endonuclease subunit Sen54 [Schizosaccharomyces japonicus yFS275]EEB05729.1 tRNA-splicing endonuclease subunit Sen54 [Schizosaccharomyces japonicus yFS275]